MVLDDTLVPMDDAVKGRLKSENATVYAVALTPKEAGYYALTLGMSEKESKNTARQFCDAFETIKDIAPNITLYNSKMNVIYHKENGEKALCDEMELNKWVNACRQSGVGGVSRNLGG